MNKIKQGLVIALLLSITAGLYIVLFTDIWIPQEYRASLGM